MYVFYQFNSINILVALNLSMSQFKTYDQPVPFIQLLLETSVYLLFEIQLMF